MQIPAFQFLEMMEFFRAVRLIRLAGPPINRRPEAERTQISM